MNWDTAIGALLAGVVAGIIYLWQRFVGKSDKATDSLLSLQLAHLEEKIDECLAELKLKVDKEDCKVNHVSCAASLIRGFDALDLKRNISDCVAKELQRDANLENRRKAINGHTHDASGKAIFGGME